MRISDWSSDVCSSDLSAVVGAFALGDPAPAGQGAGSLDAQHDRLGAGVGKAQVFEVRHPGAEELRQRDLRQGRIAEAGAQGELALQRGHRSLVAMTVDERREVVLQVEKLGRESGRESVWTYV